MSQPERTFYRWPDPKSWKRMTPEERRLTATALKEQADRQRSPVFEGDETEAQRQARFFLEHVDDDEF